MQINDFISFKFNPIYYTYHEYSINFQLLKKMKILFKIFLLILSTLLIQNKAFSNSKNSGKVSVSVSVNKTDKSDNKSAEAKTDALANKSIENITSSSKDNTSVSKTTETPSFKDNSRSSNNNVVNNNLGNKVDGYKFIRKYEISKQERLFDAIKYFKNEENLSKGNLKKIDGLINKRIEEITKKIKFKFNEDDGIQFFKITENTNYDIEMIEKKAELVDYVQKTFEVMGIIN